MPHLSLDLLKSQAAFSRWLTEETQQGFMATDAGFRVVIWNRWMERHSGYTAGDVLGRSLFEVYPDAEARGLRDYFDEALGGRVTMISHGLHEYLLPMPATAPELGLAQMPQSGRIGPLSDGAAVVGTLTVLEDVSDRLATEAELKRQIDAQRLARATAEKALRAKDEFLSTLSHEIRTPLNAVLGWARILLERGNVEVDFLRHALTVIERNAAVQARMIDDLLDMARIAAGKLRLEMRQVDLEAVLLAAADVVMPAAAAKGIAVRTAIQAHSPQVLGDPDRLQQIVMNVLSNSLKFTESGGSIDLELGTAGRQARILVRDTGRGIVPEFLPYVFDRFRQDDASSARRHGGLGLGLALVRELAELHGGRVHASSGGQDQGTTITIELPLLPEGNDAVSRGRTRRETSPRQVLDGVRVLLVEDESDSREFARTALENGGAQVVAVSSAADAIAEVLASSPKTRPQVIVADIGLPGEDGYVLIRRIRALPRERGGEIPAITVTGYASPEDADRTLAAGFQRHLPKPIDPAHLVEEVSRLAQASEEAAGGPPQSIRTSDASGGA